MYTVKLTESYFPAQTDTSFEPMTIREMVRNQATKIPDKIALIELGYDGLQKRRWSYADIYEQSQKLAHCLVSRHPKGARVAVFANNVPEWILLELATAMAGLVLVTVNPSFQARELKYVLEQSGSEAIYYVKDVRGNPLDKIVDEACDGLDGIKHRIILNDLDALFAGSEGDTLPSMKPSDIVQIQYTSGTTGFPKGALLHHTGLLQGAKDMMHRGGLQQGDAFAQILPLFHTSGCALGVLGGLSCGATILLPPVFDPEMLCQVIAREKLRYLLGVPTMIVAIMAESERSGADISSIERLMSGGSMVPPQLVKKSIHLFGSPIQILYGQTESSPMITQTWVTDNFEDLTETAGQAVPHVEVSIRDMKSNKVCPLDTQGEICVRGYNVMTGYNDNPEATKAAIDKDGWLHTGDLGQMDERGYIRITGRVKDMIIRGGENIFPVEIENAMLEHPDVTEVAVVGIPDETWGEVVTCFMRSESGTRHKSDTLKAFIRDRISPQKTPTHWIWVNEWPLTGSGKIQKFVLRDQFVEGKFG